MKKRKYLTLLLVFVLICTVSGQVVPPPMPPPPPPGLPVDGGLLFLLISGLIFGVKKIKDNL
ncbi:hypothetical protein H9W90_14030 [Polaribacter pectinis]|uniref:Uncharacterized protein n=1 Tax=Polaribacter pectinis TaxID=2738844 RepID=A0A7G9L9J2_9FLAO|nr:hypothetical protein [Polaribacter pectinis]QNM85291.1 hypothetical protein H9W90_14030 [Polaribacter pectinis]